MRLDERLDQLDRLARGELTLRDLAGLEASELEALAHLGRAAFESGHFDRAARVFAGLERIEPDVPVHVLRRAHAEARDGRASAALDALNRYLDREEHRPKSDLQEALLLRANLLRTADPEAAYHDVQAAQILAEQVRGASR
jgi:regulator of sirC expression with transglutaminase-like and TPR domain